MSDRVLVTGAASGIGLAASIGLPRRGHRVVASMRDPVRAHALRAAARAAGVGNRIEEAAPDVAADASAVGSAVPPIADDGGIDAPVNQAVLAELAEPAPDGIARHGPGSSGGFVLTLRGAVCGLPPLGRPAAARGGRSGRRGAPDRRRSFGPRPAPAPPRGSGRRSLRRNRPIAIGNGPRTQPNGCFSRDAR